MQFFDTHAHIGLIYDDPIEQLRVIQQAKQAGVSRIISINNSLLDFKRVYNTLKAVTGIYHAVGVAPSEVTNPGKDYASVIEESIKLPNVVAVGETGLDYYKQFGDKRSQIELFITQLEIAQKHNLPVIIHNRDAGKDIFDVLSERIPQAGAIFHCYSEDADYAKRCLDALKKLGVTEGTMAVAGLNPHSGEHGLFGTEEVTDVTPAVEALQKEGYPVAGPVGADSVFHLALTGKFNSVLSLYHDQGHIATKTLDFERTISVTGGMPILRTSVDHGTAMDIAGTGQASAVSMIEAIRLAVKYSPNFING